VAGTARVLLSVIVGDATMDVLIVAVVVMYVIIFVLGIRAAVEPYLVRRFANRRPSAPRGVRDKGVASDRLASSPRRAA